LQSNAQLSIFLLRQNRKPLLIVAEDVESEALYTWIIDKLCGRVKVGLALFMLSCSDFCTDLFNRKSKAGLCGQSS
jgi:chaperonin GroEL (HSP60 family)